MHPIAAHALLATIHGGGTSVFYSPAAIPAPRGSVALPELDHGADPGKYVMVDGTTFRLMELWPNTGLVLQDPRRRHSQVFHLPEPWPALMREDSRIIVLRFNLPGQKPWRVCVVQEEWAEEVGQFFGLSVALRAAAGSSFT